MMYNAYCCKSTKYTPYRIRLESVILLVQQQLVFQIVPSKGGEKILFLILFNTRGSLFLIYTTIFVKLSLMNLKKNFLILSVSYKYEREHVMIIIIIIIVFKVIKPLKCCKEFIVSVAAVLIAIIKKN